MTDNVFLEQILDHIVLAIEVIAVIFITGIVILSNYVFKIIHCKNSRETSYNKPS
jgi:cytochrome b subunit of formate dehydrogenase